MRAAVVQLNSQDDIEANLLAVDTLVDGAAAAGATLILLPENFALMGNEEKKRDVAERADGSGPILSRLRAAALRSHATIIGGGMPIASGDGKRPFNSCVVVTPHGEISAVYNKIHLFDVKLADGSVYDESASSSAGTEPVVVEVPAGGAKSNEVVKVGLSICYDLRFPELYRRLSAMQADVVVVPAAFTLLTGKDHWHALLRARAIENQCFVLAAAQHGKHPQGRQTYGKSQIIDAWGDLVAQRGEGVGFAIADLDFAALRKVRSELPVLSHRRL